MHDDLKLKYLKYSHKRFIEFARFEIYDLNFLNLFVNLKKPKLYCLTSIAKEQLGVDPQRFKEVIRKVKRYDLRFGALIDNNKIGLRKVIVFTHQKFNNIKEIPSKSWIRSIVNSVSPRGTYLIYYYPWKGDINKLLTEFNENDVKLLCTKTYARTPILNAFFDWSNLRMKMLYQVTGKIKRELEEKLIRKGDENEGKSSDEEALSIGFPKDWLDILIIKELEKDAFIGVEGLSKALGYGKKNIRKHFINHVNDVVVTIRPKFTVLNPELSVPVAVTVYDRDVKLLRSFIEVLSKTPYLTMAVECNDATVLQFIVYYKDLPYLDSFLRDVGIMDFNVNICTYIGSKTFTIPWSNYNLWKRAWALRHVEVIEERLTEKLKRRVRKLKV